MSTITVETECGRRQWYEDRREAEASRLRHRERCEACEDDDIRLVEDPDQVTLRTVAAREREASERASGATGAASRVGERDRERRVDGAGAASARPDGSSAASPAVSDAARTPSSASDGPPTASAADLRDVAIRAEAITTAGETDHAYAEFRATAWLKDEGPEQGYTGHGTARAAEDRPGIEHRLNEVAETRAMERALAWAAGTHPVPLDGSADGGEA